MERVISNFDELVGAGVLSESAGRLIASPNTAEEVTAVMRYVDRNGLKVAIAGAGTKSRWAGAVNGNLVLRTCALAGVREHSWQDLTATVGAGTIWAEMQRVLAQQGQQVALDPLWPERATLGGVIATNDSGALRLKCGSLRDLVIGMTVVLADGTIAKSGGKVVKNVAGYDLHKLMIGAFGTLAVVVEVTFRLHAVALSTRVWTFEGSDAEVVGGVMMKVLDSQLNVQSMQMRADAAGFALDVQLVGMAEVLQEQVGMLDGFAGASGAAGSVDVFGARERLFSGDGVVVKVTMLAAAVAPVSAEVIRLGGEAVTQAVGIMFARFDLSRTEAGIAALKELGAGSVTVLRGADGFGMLPSVGSQAGLMREIKRRFDPKETLNPGVVIGV